MMTFDLGDAVSSLGRRRQPIHDRHFDVENDDVDGQTGDLGHGDAAIRGRPDYSDVLVAFQDSRQQTTNDGTVFDHHDADRAVVFRRLSRRSPAVGSTVSGQT